MLASAMSGIPTSISVANCRERGENGRFDFPGRQSTRIWAFGEAKPFLACA